MNFYFISLSFSTLFSSSGIFGLLIILFVLWSPLLGILDSAETLDWISEIEYDSWPLLT